MRATRSAAAAAGGAAPREWVAVAWGLHQAGVAFSGSFTARLLQALAKDRGMSVVCVCGEGGGRANTVDGVGWTGMGLHQAVVAFSASRTQ